MYTAYRGATCGDAARRFRCVRAAKVLVLPHVLGLKALSFLLALALASPAAAQDLQGCCPEMPEPMLVGGLDSLQVHLVYPSEAAEAGVEGRVLVKLLVGSTGEGSELKVVRSPGPRLNDEALRVASKARFEWPEGTPERWRRIWCLIPVLFRLSP